MKRINPQDASQRGLLRFLGVGFTGIGLVLVVVGFGSFFSSFGSFGAGPPRYFWCAFIGIPLLGLGTFLLKMGFLGTIGRYISGEYAPVAKDTFNYMGSETTPGVRNFSRAFGEGLREGMSEAQDQNFTVEERLERLKQLHEQALISTEEYEQQRTRILSEL